MNIKKLIIEISESGRGLSSSSVELQLLPFPCCIIDPYRNTIVGKNASFEKLIGSDKELYTASSYFSRHTAELQTFTQAVLTLGGAQTNDLKLSTGNSEPIECLILGSRIQLDTTLGCLFAFLSREEIVRSDNLREANESFRSGLVEWKRLEVLYHQAESLNDLILNSAGDGILGSTSLEIQHS